MTTLGWSKPALMCNRVYCQLRFPYFQANIRDIIHQNALWRLKTLTVQLHVSLSEAPTEKYSLV